MSTDSSSPVEYSALSDRVEAIESDTKALGEAMSRSRRSRLLVFGCLLAIVVVFSYLFLNLGKRFTDPDKQKEFAGIALDHFFDGIDHARNFSVIDVDALGALQGTARRRQV